MVPQTPRNPNLPDPNNPMGGLQGTPAPMAAGAPMPAGQGSGSQQFAALSDPNNPMASWRDPNAMFSGAGADPMNQMDLTLQREQAARRNDQFGSNASFDADLRRRADETFAEFERTLNPQWEQRAREFEQSLVGRGIDPNSEAGRNARAEFDRSRTDAFSQARRAANADGVALQQQRWQQQFAQDQADAQLRMENMRGLAGQQNAIDARDFEMRRFNEDTRRYNQGFGEDVRRYDQGFDFNMGQADFGMLMQMLGMDQGMAGFNNNAGMQEQNAIYPWMSMIPQGGPAGIDVMGPYNMQLQAQTANAQNAASRSNGFWGGLGQLGGGILGASNPPWWLSDARAKEEIRQIGLAHNGLPLYAFRYKIGGPTRIGLMAQDVEAIDPSAVIEVNGIKMVDYEKALA